MEEKKDERRKDQTAKEIAEIMVENMKANMADPDFWSKKEERMRKARDKVLKERKLREIDEK